MIVENDGVVVEIEGVGGVCVRSGVVATEVDSGFLVR